MSEEATPTVGAVSDTAEDTITATDTSAQQGDTVSGAGVEEAGTKDLLSEDQTQKASEEAKTDSDSEQKASDDLLGEVKQEGSEQAPEKYEPFTLADGKEMDAADVEAISEIAKEHNLSQESAQKAALVANDLVEKMVASHEAEMAKVMEQNAAEWKKADPTGEKTLLARKAVEKLGPEMHAHLKDNGYLNDHRIMSLLATYGQQISEGKSISGKPATQQSLLYPSTPELYNNS